MQVIIQERFYDILKDTVQRSGHEVVKDKQVADIYIGFADKNLNKTNYPNLQYIQLMSAGFDGLDIDRLKADGITVMNARGIYSEAIAEYIVGHVLNVLKNIPLYQDRQKNKIWHKDVTIEGLKGKKVFYLGTGSIAQETLKRMSAFGTINYGFNSDGRLIDGFEKCYPLKNYKSYIKDADIIIASLPSNDETNHLLSGEEFKLMKDNTIFINVGRGSLINERTLKDNIDHLRALILDVFEVEPLSKDSFLWECDNVVITPHISAFDIKSDENRKQLVENNLKLIKNGGPVINKVI